MKIASTVLFTIALWLISGAATAVDMLRVGVLQASPFASQVGDHYQGLTIDLWEKIAANNHWAFSYLSAGTDESQAISQLQAGRFDILIGPLSVTGPSLAVVDFSRPFFINKTGVIVLKHRSHFLSLLDPVLSKSFAALTLALLSAFLIYIHLFWYFERGKHPEISEGYWKTVSSGLWIHVIKKGFGGMPTTLYGKFTVLFWLLCVGLFLTTFNANVTSAFTVALAKQYDSIKNFGDLQQLQLAGVEGSAAANLAIDQGLTLVYVKNLEEAIDLLQDNEVGGIVYDSVIGLNYLSSHHSTKLVMSAYMFAQEEYAFALPYHSPLTRALNMSLVELQDNQQVSRICQKFIGAEQAKNCQL